jgi:hypothetical protein
MTESAELILQGLEAVALERRRRGADAALGAAVLGIKRFQHARFALTYADLMAQSRYRGAAQFFLNDLYGPGDFSDRDNQFGRIVPALVRLFSREIVATVANLAQLHALSEQLDSAMGAELAAAGMPALDGQEYGRLWRAVGEPGQRRRQIELMVSVGAALDRYTRSTLLRQSLRLMRGPAAAAGLGALQGFLERGFDTFRAMGGAEEFLDTVTGRETALAQSLFAGGNAPSPSTVTTPA